MTVFRQLRSVLVESPIWVDDRMIWVDISVGTVREAREGGARDGSDDEVHTVEAPLTALAPAPDGWVAALGDRVVLLDADFAVSRTLANVQHRHPLMRLNEGKCDPFGAFLVASMEMGDMEGGGALYRVHPDGRLETLLGGLTVGNGIEFSDDGRTLYLTDTGEKTVYRAEYDPEGPLGPLTPVIREHSFDGLVRDDAGGFFSACYGEGVVLRWTERDGVLETYDLPAPNATGIGFGGAGLGTLFVGTARENLDEEALTEHPLSGSVFALDTGTRGLPVRRFGARTKDDRA